MGLTVELSQEESEAPMLGRSQMKSVGSCDSTEMWRPAIRHTPHSPILSYLDCYTSHVSEHRTVRGL